MSAEKLSPIPCFFDERLDCNSDCRIFEINKRTIEEVADLENITPDEYSRITRSGFFSFSPRELGNRIIKRIKGFEENGGNLKECKQFENNAEDERKLF